MLMLVSPLADGAMAKQATPISPEAFVEKGIDTVISILKDRDTTKRQKFFQLQSAFRRYFAHRRIAKFAAGRYYKEAPKATRDKYIRVLEGYLLRVYGAQMLSYSNQIDLRLKATDIFNITGVTPRSNRHFIVHTRLNRRWASFVSFDWYLIRVGSTYKIVDLSVLGISQARAYRDQFTSVMRRSGRGLEGLVSAIEAKAKELENAAVD